MPTYRSPDEAEIRDEVVALTRKSWPNARIIHEINASGQGSNRIDVLAVDLKNIAAFEIKSKKDKLDRLQKQMTAMNLVTRKSYGVIHDKFFEDRTTNKHNPNSWKGKDGQHWMKHFPPIQGVRTSNIWRYSEGVIDLNWNWRSPYPDLSIQESLPYTALGILWAAELRDMCGRLRIGLGKRPNMETCRNAITWYASGKEITEGICQQLRMRQCIEADPAITPNTGE